MQTLDERLDARMQHLRTKFDGSDDVREAQLLLSRHDELQSMSTVDDDRIQTIIKGEFPGRATNCYTPQHVLHASQHLMHVHIC